MLRPILSNTVKLGKFVKDPHIKPFVGETVQTVKELLDYAKEIPLPDYEYHQAHNSNVDDYQKRLALPISRLAHKIETTPEPPKEWKECLAHFESVYQSVADISNY